MEFSQSEKVPERGSVKQLISNGRYSQYHTAYQSCSIPSQFKQEEIYPI